MTFTVAPKIQLVSGNSNCLREACINVAKHRFFEGFIIVCILLNMVTLAANHYMISDDWATALEVLNLAFMFIFAVEAFIKIVAYKQDYFRDNWNLFDFIIIVLAVFIFIPISLGYLAEYQGLTMAIRVLRVARMLRLLYKARKLQNIY